MRKITLMKQFKKDYKRMLKQPFCTDEFLTEFQAVINRLANDLPIDTDKKKYYDHPLKGNNKGCRELHLMPDWLLMYSKTDDTIELLLMRTGKHQDLFNE